MNLGNRIITEFKRPDQDLLERFWEIPSSNIGDMMNRLFNMQGDMMCLNKRVTLLGPAFTVKVPEGDNLMFHAAMDLAQAGDVLVVDAGGGKSRSLCGEMMYSEAMMRGLAGFVVNGAVRDTDSLERLDFPVYATGVTPQGPWKNGPGEIGVPVCCGGVVVHPGDIIAGDADGIVVIPLEQAEEVAALAREKFRGEQETLEKRARGEGKLAEGKWLSLAVKAGAQLL